MVPFTEILTTLPSYVKRRRRRDSHGSGSKPAFATVELGHPLHDTSKLADKHAVAR